MTALERYIRLEALGQWREGEGAEPREVVVRFGQSTLVLSDVEENPLGHWALAGVQAVGREGPARVYAMAPEGAETLAIVDADMVEAIAAVTRAHLLRAAPVQAPPARRWIGALAGAVVFAGVIALIPPLLRGQAARMVPAEAMTEFGGEMLLQIMAARGPLCADPAGLRALGLLGTRVSQGRPVQLRALDLGPAPVVLLPGPAVLVGRAALAQAEDPAEIAGWIALALAREDMRPAPERLMQAVGPWSNLRYVLTGRLGERDLAKATRAALTPPVPEEITAAYERLLGAGLATAPFADGLRRAGLEAPPSVSAGDAALPDQDWVALQGLCG